MFEYLMPLLFHRSFENLLDNAHRQAVARQIEYGGSVEFRGAFPNRPSARSMRIRFISIARSAFPLYAAPTTEQELVVSPYSTMLALMVDPDSAIENLKKLEQLGLYGPDGLL